MTYISCFSDFAFYFYYYFMENCHTWIIISMWQNDLHTNTSRSVWPILYGLMIKMLQYKMYPAGELAVLRQLLLRNCINLKYLDTLTLYHTWTKIWTIRVIFLFFSGSMHIFFFVGVVVFFVFFFFFCCCCFFMYFWFAKDLSFQNLSEEMIYIKCQTPIFCGQKKNIYI